MLCCMLPKLSIVGVVLYDAPDDAAALRDEMLIPSRVILKSCFGCIQSWG